MLTKTYRPPLVVLAIVAFSLISLYHIYNRRHDYDNFGNKHAPNTVEKERILEYTNDPIPRRDFTSLLKYPPQNINEPIKYAYATLYCSRTPDIQGPYFQAAQQIIWRLLWTPYRSKYPVIVYVCPFIPEGHRKILRGQGAIIKEIGLLDDIIPNEALLHQRWMDVMSKLNLWGEVEWTKIVFLDLDAFPIANMDELFDLVPMQRCITEKLSKEDRAVVENGKGGDEMCNYIFAGVKQYETFVVNAGVMLLTPNLDMHARLLRGARRTDEYVMADVEQGVLMANVGFGLDSAFPTYYIEQKWNGFLDDYKIFVEQNAAAVGGDLRVVHAKAWDQQLGQDHPLRLMWNRDWMDMCRFYDGNLFPKARETGIIRFYWEDG
jgi:inositol 3-alpha-galactosyltransferase